MRATSEKTVVGRNRAGRAPRRAARYEVPGSELAAETAAQKNADHCVSFPPSSSRATAPPELTPLA